MEKLIFLISALLAGHVHCGDKIPDRICGTLYSSDGSSGSDNFILMDFDSSPNFKKDNLHTTQPWTEVTRIRVEDGCTMTVCDQIFSNGTCFTLNTGDHVAPSKDLLSANCTCKRECSCQDYIAQMDQSLTEYFARAYVNGDCNTCDSEYVRLQPRSDLNFVRFPKTYPKNYPKDAYLIKDIAKYFPNLATKVKALMLPKGCNMTIRTEGKEYTNISELLNLEFNEIISSYNLHCNSIKSTVPQPPEKWTPEPPEIPPLEMTQKLSDLYSLNQSYPNNPVVKDGITSAENRRSFNSATVIVIGSLSAHHIGFPHCRGPRYLWSRILECHIPVWLENHGFNLTLRVIMFEVGRKKEDETDTRLEYTLEQMFVKKHGDRHQFIPNAVILYHEISRGDYSTEGSFQTALRLVKKMGANFVDEKNSNFLIMLSGTFRYHLSDMERNGMYEEAFKKYFSALPVRIYTKEYMQRDEDERFVNGYTKMTTNEYWPRNLALNLANICEKGGDPLGKAIFKAYFEDNSTPHLSIEPIFHELLHEKTTEVNGRLEDVEQVQASEEGWREGKISSDEDTSIRYLQPEPALPPAAAPGDRWTWGGEDPPEPYPYEDHMGNSEENGMSSHERLRRLIRKNKQEIMELKALVEQDRWGKLEDAERKLEIYDRVQVDIRQLFE